MDDKRQLAEGKLACSDAQELGSKLVPEPVQDSKQVLETVLGSKQELALEPVLGSKQVLELVQDNKELALELEPEQGSKVLALVQSSKVLALVREQDNKALAPEQGSKVLVQALGSKVLVQGKQDHKMVLEQAYNT